MKQIVTAFFLCAALSLISVPPTPAQAQSQAEMNQQAAKDFDAADAAMNKAYKQLISKLDKEAQAKLKSAQRAWVAFRDAQADLESDLEARGGSMAPMIYEGSRTATTKERTKELQNLLKEYGT